MTDGDLSGKVCLITGSTRGIGRAIAERFAREGAHVVVHGRSAENATRVAAELGGVHASLGVGADLSAPGAATALVEAAAGWQGTLDVVVNNAGVDRNRDLANTTDEDWEACLRTNVSAPFELLRAVVPIMKAGGRGGAVVNVVSWSGLRGNPGQVAYSASKGALYSLTLTLAKELAKHGIRVNALSPIAETEMVGALPEQAYQATLRRVPMHRFGTMAEIAEGALFLASDRSAYTTGQILNIDGGTHLV